jgi:hypothetical protein
MKFRMAASLVTVVVALSGIGCSSSPKSRPSSAIAVKPTAKANEPDNWYKTEKTDPMDGFKEIVLTTNAIDHIGALIIRFQGKKLEVYVNADEILDNGTVKIKFDDGTPVKQNWGRSTDYKAVFAPDAFSLLTKLQHSKKFYLQYQPYERLPETTIFDVTTLSDVLPRSQMAVLQKKVDDDKAATAALRAIVLPYVHLCVDQHAFPGEWCYTGDEPAFTNDSTPFPTKEEAIKSALESARAGVAFKNHTKASSQ